MGGETREPASESRQEERRMERVRRVELPTLGLASKIRLIVNPQKKTNR